LKTPSKPNLSNNSNNTNTLLSNQINTDTITKGQSTIDLKSHFTQHDSDFSDAENEDLDQKE